MAAKKSPSGLIVKLKVTLKNIKPPIWRRLLLPATMTLKDLHDAIQVSMGWEDCHLHVFDIEGRQYGIPTPEMNDVAAEFRVRLEKLVHDGVKKFRYWYDFGDDWDHTIAIEGTMPAAEGARYPACIAGKRAGPPEDCGGPWGYAELLEILEDPDHPEHEERLEWLGGGYDPDDFSVEAADVGLAARFSAAKKLTLG